MTAIHLGDCQNGCTTCADNYHAGQSVCDTCGSDVHQHEPWGTEYRLVERDDYSMVSAKCKCGTILIRETAPIGAGYNWEEWRVTR